MLTSAFSFMNVFILKKGAGQVWMPHSLAQCFSLSKNQNLCLSLLLALFESHGGGLTVSVNRKCYKLQV